MILLTVECLPTSIRKEADSYAQEGFFNSIFNRHYLLTNWPTFYIGKIVTDIRKTIIFLGNTFIISNNNSMDSIKVNGYYLDEQQMKIVLDESKSLLVVAGAGSGKTLTIVGKIKYLIEYKKVNPEEILCISFTNDSTKSLKDKLSQYNIDVFTFHKLGLKILEKSKLNYNIASSDYLEFIVHEFLFGIVLENEIFMRKILRYFNIFCLFKTEEKYKTFLKSRYNEIISFEKLIVKFIRLYKTNGYTISFFYSCFNKTFKHKERLFLLIALNIYLVYTKDLASSGLIDFDDMLIKSREEVERSKVKLNYKYIIIDEYQDTSYIRYLLIKSIIDKTNAKFIAVGDDFQSIYRFSGCDLNMFTCFLDFFPQGNILKIEKTYRNSMELIDIAGNFVMKNKYQIKKELKSDKSIKKPIVICYYKSIKNDFEKLINLIKGNIMILGRNNKDINLIISKDIVLDNNNLIYKNDYNVSLRYYTVHRSKGLEEENVIVLNVIDDELGFPNKIENNKVIRFVLNEKSNYLFDEERRLFYVALTRTKNKVYLLTKEGNESVFIRELIRKYDVEVINIK